MSQKNTREAKKRRKVANSLANTPPAYIDLIDYVKLRTRCSTSMAKKVLLAGALRVDSHPVGYKLRKGDVKELDPFLPAHMRDRIVVQMPPEFKNRDA